jgi:dihydrofolate reductase
MAGVGEFGVKMNTMTKYVVSSTLDTVEWPGSQLITGDLTTEIGTLKARPGRDLLLSGSAQLFNACAKADLIDLYRFMLHPIVIGHGAKLFDDGAQDKALTLSNTKTFSSGIVILEYTP